MMQITSANATANVRENARESASASANVSRDYIEATWDDARLAERLLREILTPRRDDLLPQTRLLLQRLDEYVAERARTERKPRARIRFTQRELRETLGWGDFAVRRHLSRLVELEYVLVHRTGPGNQRQYELLPTPVLADLASAPSAG